MYIIPDSLLGWSLWITFRKINSAQVYKGIKCAWNFAYYSFSSILFPLNTIKYCKYFYTVNYESISKCVCWNTWVSHFLEIEQTYYFEHRNCCKQVYEYYKKITHFNSINRQYFSNKSRHDFFVPENRLNCHILDKPFFFIVPFDSNYLLN